MWDLIVLVENHCLSFYFTVNYFYTLRNDAGLGYLGPSGHLL